jgi:DNA-binding LacI/PurR family transcriptional regulator
MAGQRDKPAASGRTTMHDIASHADVSVGTVSHVLNGTATVREVLKRRVLKSIEELGYSVNNLSRGLRRNKTNLIGVIILDIMNPFFPAVVRGVEDLAFKSNYRVLLCNADNDVKKKRIWQTFSPFSPLALFSFHRSPPRCRRTRCVTATSPRFWEHR